LQRNSGLFRDLKLNPTAGLMLDNRRPVSHAAARSYVIDPKADEIAAAQLAIDSEVEHRKIAFAALYLKSDTNGPDFFRPKGALLANEAAFVPCGARRSGVGLDFGGHGRPPRSHRSARVQQAGQSIAQSERQVSARKPLEALRESRAAFGASKTGIRNAV
jgi:hypothetical protein